MLIGHDRSELEALVIFLPPTLCPPLSEIYYVQRIVHHFFQRKMKRPQTSHHYRIISTSSFSKHCCLFAIGRIKLFGQAFKWKWRLAETKRGRSTEKKAIFSVYDHRSFNDWEWIEELSHQFVCSSLATTISNLGYGLMRLPLRKSTSVYATSWNWGFSFKARH